LGTLTLVAQMLGSNINTAITNGQVALYTTDGGKIWTCSTTVASGQAALSTALSSKYLPSACR
jgi:photosystem II stability/assembly factor-like uncharacterized protein